LFGSPVEPLQALIYPVHAEAKCRPGLTRAVPVQATFARRSKLEPILLRARICAETGVISSPRKTVVTMQILLENQLQWIEGVSGRAFGPGLAF
jgi:hypothetical protein